MIHIASKKRTCQYFPALLGEGTLSALYTYTLSALIYTYPMIATVKELLTKTESPSSSNMCFRDGNRK